MNCASQGCQNSDSNDADASIGIGLRGQSTSPPEMGAGWTEYFASGKGTCNHNSKTYKSVWMWVLPVSQWKLAMKVGSKTDKLGYSSPLWTNTELLNQASPMQEEADAKYAEYLSVPFKEIRMCVGSPTSNCVTHQFSKTYDNAKALFSSGYIRDATVKRDELLKAFGPTPGSYQDCPMQRCQPQFSWWFFDKSNSSNSTVCQAHWDIPHLLNALAPSITSNRSKEIVPRLLFTLIIDLPTLRCSE